MRVVITAAAQTDLEDIASYIAYDSIAAARRLIDRFKRLFKTLRNHPYAGVAIEGDVASRRKIAIGNYLVIYRVEPEVLQILNIFHGARDIENLLNH